MLEPRQRTLLASNAPRLSFDRHHRYQCPRLTDITGINAPRLTDITGINAPRLTDITGINRARLPVIRQSRRILTDNIGSLIAARLADMYGQLRAAD